MTPLCDALLALTPGERVRYACDCARRALDLWEAARPEDRRPQALLAAIEGWLVGEEDPAELERLSQAVWACQNPHEIDPPTRAARAIYWIGAALAEEDEAQADCLAEAVEGAVHALAEAVWEEAYASDEMVADLKQAHAENVERRWQRSRLCQVLLGADPPSR
ncbi:MAG: Imm5 family immunity protein [Planctomycetota bacterium]